MWNQIGILSHLLFRLFQTQKMKMNGSCSECCLPIGNFVGHFIDHDLIFNLLINIVYITNVRLGYRSFQIFSLAEISDFLFFAFFLEMLMAAFEDHSVHGICHNLLNFNFFHLRRIEKHVGVKMLYTWCILPLWHCKILLSPSFFFFPTLS